MRDFLLKEMKGQRYNCSTLASDTHLSRYALAKIIADKREAKAAEIVAISETLHLKINSIKDIKDIFLS